MRLLLSLSFFLSILTTSGLNVADNQQVTNAIDTPGQFYTVLDEFLSEQVDAAGLIDYASLQADTRQLDRLYKFVSTFSPDRNPELFPNEAARLAYWINAYNIATMVGVVRHYPIESVRDVRKFSLYSLFSGGGFFAAQKFRFGDKKMSLYHLENKVIRKRFTDERFHFALNCASLGCPILPQSAFRPTSLDQQLAQETRKFVNDPKNVRIDKTTQSIAISSIFDWYAEDFPNPQSLARKRHLLNYVYTYATEPLRFQIERAIEDGYALQFIDYDWRLNDQTR